VRDTNNAATASTAGKGSAKPNLAKKGHKGRVRTAIYNRRMTDKMESDKNGVYNYTEIMPQYPGGQNNLDQFIQTHIEYPQDAIDNGVEGTVTVIFAVDKQGKVSSPYVQGSKLGYGLDDEAIKVVNEMPKWTPGSIKGKTVKTYYYLPITFTLL
jgi:TonB family protein